MSKVKEAVRAGVQYYVGMKCTVELQEDPGVENTFAVRATLSNGEVHDFLLVGGDKQIARLTPQQLEPLLEDIEFSCWPPKSSGQASF